MRLFGCGEHAAAARAFRRALAIEPGNDDLHLKLGAALSAGGDSDGAIVLYRAVLARDPNHLGAMTNLGNAFIRLGRGAEAIRTLAKAVAVHPDSGFANFSLGFALQTEDRLDEAALAYRAALPDQEIGPLAAANLGTVLGRLGRHEEALQVYDAALATAPEDANLRWNRAGTLLLLGDHERGWRDYEWRWRTQAYAHALRHGDTRLWHGEPLKGARILLHAEQGFGDTIQFARYIPEVAARGGRIALEVQPALKPLFVGFPGVDSVHAVGEALPECALQCPLPGLPLRIGGIPNRVPYLSIPADRRGTYRDPNRQDQPHVGLVWAGSPTNSADRRRSLDPGRLEPLTRIQGIVFVNLQAGRDSNADSGLATAMPDPMPGVRDFADTAAIISALDLVISVDTAVAHLAGALGKPVWLLNRFDTCWRWLLEREDSPWYPTMRIFRQPYPGDWATPVARVAAELADQAKPHAGGRIF